MASNRRPQHACAHGDPSDPGRRHFLTTTGGAALGLTLRHLGGAVSALFVAGALAENGGVQVDLRRIAPQV